MYSTNLYFPPQTQREVTALTDYDSDSVFLPADAPDDSAASSADGKVAPPEGDTCWGDLRAV